MAEGNVELSEGVLTVKGADSGMFRLVMRKKVLRMMDSPWGRIQEIVDVPCILVRRTIQKSK